MTLRLLKDGIEHEFELSNSPEYRAYGINTDYSFSLSRPSHDKPWTLTTAGREKRFQASLIDSRDKLKEHRPEAIACRYLMLGFRLAGNDPGLDRIISDPTFVATKATSTADKLLQIDFEYNRNDTLQNGFGSGTFTVDPARSHLPVAIAIHIGDGLNHGLMKTKCEYINSPLAPVMLPARHELQNTNENPRSPGDMVQVQELTWRAANDEDAKHIRLPAYGLPEPAEAETPWRAALLVAGNILIAVGIVAGVVFLRRRERRASPAGER
jgi:hypothetical protein